MHRKYPTSKCLRLIYQALGTKKTTNQLEYEKHTPSKAARRLPLQSHSKLRFLPDIFELEILLSNL